MTYTLEVLCASVVSKGTKDTVVEKYFSNF